MNAIYFDSQSKVYKFQQTGADFDMQRGTLKNVGTLLIPTLDVDAAVGSALLGLTGTDKNDVEKVIEALAGVVNTIGSADMNITGEIDCSLNPPYPAASKGDVYRITAPGRIGGASGKYVDADSLVVCHLTSITGDEATVGVNWTVVQGNTGVSVWPATDNNAIAIYGDQMTSASAMYVNLNARTGGVAGVIDLNIGTVSIEEAEAGIIRIVDSRPHDDLAADICYGTFYSMSGAIPGSQASVFSLNYIEYKGTIGAAGANATLYGLNVDFSNGTYTDGTIAGVRVEMAAATGIGVTTNARGYFGGSVTVDAPFNYVNSATGNDTYAGNMAPALTGLTTGQMVILIADTANTGACTLDINGVGAQNIKTVDGADPANNDILAGKPALLIFDGTQFSLLNPMTVCT